MAMALSVGKMGAHVQGKAETIKDLNSSLQIPRAEALALQIPQFSAIRGRIIFDLVLC